MQKKKGIWIPAEILLNNDLSDKEKIILSIIIYLSDETGSCFASNKYISSIVNVTSDRVSKIVSSLKKKEYIEVTLKFKVNSKEVESRQIIPNKEKINRYGEKYLEGIGENIYSTSQKQPYPIGENNKDIIMYEMIFTSDREFFDNIGEEETKRYFEENYKFVCNYKNLGEENIISAVVHLDEGVPHMHLVFVPVVHTKDKDGNEIDKICSRDFWKGRDSYRTLQNNFYDYITSKGFELERGIEVEQTGAKHEKIEDLKKITNFENTKKVLDNIKLELPEVPDINDIKIIKLNREKVENEIIKPKDIVIHSLYQDNVNLHRQLSRQAQHIIKKNLK